MPDNDRLIVYDPDTKSAQPLKDYMKQYSNNKQLVPPSSIKPDERKNLKQKFGPRAFLDPRELRYPIYNSEGKKDCRLIYSAYLRSIQWNEDRIRIKAEDIFRKSRCGEKLGRQLHQFKLDNYVSTFNLLESRDLYFAGNSYIIGKIDENVTNSAINQMRILTESITPTTVASINAVNKSIPIITLEFANSKLLKDSLETFITEQKNALNGNVIIPVKGIMFMDLEPLYMLNSSLKASFYKFLENASYITVNGRFQTDLFNSTNKIISSMFDNIYNHLIMGVI